MNRRLKIVQVLPALDSGGVECTVKELSDAVIRAGHESVVVSTGGNMVTELEREGARHISLPVARKSLFSLMQVRPMRRLLEKEKPDVVHVHSRVPAWITWLAWRKMPASSRPSLVTTVHGLYSVNVYSGIMTAGEIVTTVSESALQYVLKNYPSVDPGKLRAIPLGVDPHEYDSNYKPSQEWLAEWYEKFPETKGRWNLCLPGRLTRIKGHQDFLHIVRLLKEKGLPVHGIIAGGAHKRKKKYEEYVKQEVTELGLQDNITFTGHRADLRNILAFSDVNLSLTLVPESFGRTTLESLALGKPTLGYAHGGVKEQLDVFLPEGEIPVGDTSAAVEILEAWFKNKPLLPSEILFPYRLSDMTGANLKLYHELASLKSSQGL